MAFIKKHSVGRQELCQRSKQTLVYLYEIPALFPPNLYEISVVGSKDKYVHRKMTAFYIFLQNSDSPAGYHCGCMDGYECKEYQNNEYDPWGTCQQEEPGSGLEE